DNAIPSRHSGYLDTDILPSPYDSELDSGIANDEQLSGTYMGRSRSEHYNPFFIRSLEPETAPEVGVEETRPKSNLDVVEFEESLQLSVSNLSTQESAYLSPYQEENDNGYIRMYAKRSAENTH
ncbi:hypothetical protein EGW08_014649, partial [Elysia chlorotica]